METKAVVIVHFDEDGEIDYHVCGDTAVRMFIVDERAPDDRVYEWLLRCGPEVIREVIPQHSDIGSNQDKRHAAIKHAVTERQEGRRHLSAVPTEERPAP